ncbi:MAG: hypothetical protein U0570_15550 [Phycisphaerales bacterium]
MTERAPGRSGSSSLLWAAYLAVSWTWCIGMFLPVLLVRDYGIWGFVMFAAPNVLGAGAMGWVLSRQGSERCVAAHSGAVRAFSAITVAYHLWFVFFLTNAGWVSGPIWPIIAVGIFALAAISGVQARPPTESLLPYGVSLAAIAYCMFAGIQVGIPKGNVDESFGIPGAIWLIPVCAFGFLLCPYLDATFHRARQSLTDAGARTAFTLGFGVLFLVMILFTLAYAGLLLGLTTAAPRVLTAIVVHMLVQSGYTCGLHIREMPRRTKASPLWTALGAIFLLGICALTIRIPVADNIAPWFEFGYRIFLAAYGLLFPAYVWLVMLPWGHERPPARAIGAWLAVCAIAAPAFWMGFIEHREWWLEPGVGLLLIAKIFMPRPGAGATPPPEPTTPDGLHPASHA